MSPEQRAENVLRTGFDGRNGSQSFKHLIATAIREAEDAAYERAAALCDGVTEVLTKREQKHASPYFAMLIRNVKSQEP